MHVKTCQILKTQIQHTLFELKILLNGSLEKYLLNSGEEKMRNLKNLLQENGENHQPRPVVDEIVLRNKGQVRTLLTKMFTEEYQEAVKILIENLNEQLQDFDTAYNTLMKTFARLKTAIATVNLKSYQTGITTEIFPPKLPMKNGVPEIRMLPPKIDPNLISPETIEKERLKYYDDKPPTPVSRAIADTTKLVYGTLAPLGYQIGKFF